VQVGLWQPTIVVGVGVGVIIIVGAQRYSGQGTPGVQTGFTHRSSTGDATSRNSMGLAREVVPKTEVC
jgi:hypothetical protein